MLGDQTRPASSQSRIARSPWLNSDLNAVGRAIVIENKWRVQRYGVHGTFVEESGPIGNLGPTPDVIVFGLEQLPINGVAP
jgi:hypothetical protein